MLALFGKKVVKDLYPNMVFGTRRQPRQETEMSNRSGSFCVSMVRKALVALSCATVFASSAAVAAYPDRPIKLVVPYNAGGGTDILARAVAGAASEILKQPVVVENRAGASGMIGSAAVAKAPGDGYTFVMTAADTHSINPHVYPNISYDAQKDFTPVAQIGILPYALVINPKLKANNIGEFVELAKSQPGKLTYSSWGVGSSSQVAMEMLKNKTGIDLLHVPFTGAAPAMNGVISGQTDAMLVPLSLAVPYGKGGKVKVLGLGAPNRFIDAPDIKTLEEQGVTVYTSPWIGILGPANVPNDVVQKFAGAVEEALKQQQVKDALIKGGLEIDYRGPQAFGKVLQEDFERWGTTVKQAGIKAQ